jgi:hypothetical protein
MDVATALDWLQSTNMAVLIRDSLLLFPLLEAVHVIGLALVFGTIAIVDLRLLGVASTNRPFQRLAADTLKWTGGAFALTAITGALMFTTNATVYFHNGYFRAKVALLALAAVNALVFELTSRRTVAEWDQDRSAPGAARAVAALSLVVWLGVIVTGRMIGFTATRAAVAAPAPAETNFEDLFGLPASSDPAQEPGKAPE